MLKLFKAKSLKNTNFLTSKRNKKSQEKEKFEGRSMVEMLGVLAIIGVLSIGGIQGYTMAMRKYKANEAINLATKYALLIYTSCQKAIENKLEISPSDSWMSPEISEITEDNFWRCPVIPFTDSGLGSLPSDVLEIGLQMETTGANCAIADSSGFCKIGVSIISRSSGDIAMIHLRFSNKELCETTLGILGDNKTYSDGYGCSSDYSVRVPVVMN